MSHPDVKAYLLGEAAPAERRAVESHAASCPECREELGRLEATRAALLCVREEEPPRRIAFVSDREAAPAWWQVRRLFPQFVLPAMGALALIAAVAIPSLRHEPARTVVVERLPLPPPAAVEGDIEKRIQTAVAKAVADSEARQQRRTSEMLAAADRKHNIELRSVQVAFEEAWRMKEKQLSTMYVSLNRMDDGSSR